MNETKIHPNGGGTVSTTATVHPDAIIESTASVLDNATIGAGCAVRSGSVIYGNAVLMNNTMVCEKSRIGGVAFLSGATIHSGALLEKTPAILNGFEQQIVVSDDFIIVGCQLIEMAVWKTRSVALLRANGYPQKSAERIRDSIDAIHSCYVSIYSEEDLKDQYKIKI